VIVGGGPALEGLRQRYPRTVFLGYRYGASLARAIAGADVFVFPSRTDTFGIVMLEAMACGLPVAAFPVQGPLDVVRQGVTGVLDEDLAQAIRGALQLDPQHCLAFAQLHTWERCTRQFLGYLASAAERPVPATRKSASPASGRSIKASDS
jgi:glycosyltransferase involved in cell wall biosynthesis